MFGPPSGFTQCCAYLTRILTDTMLGDVDYLVASKLSELKDAWAHRQNANVVFFADCPERALVELFIKIQAPAVVFIEDPDDVTFYAIRERNLSWPWALRLTSQCFSTITDILRSEHTLILRREYELTFREFIYAIARQFQVELAETDLVSLLKRTALPPQFDLDSPIEEILIHLFPKTRRKGLAPFPDMPRSDMEVIKRVNAGIRPSYFGNRSEMFEWPQEMFISGDRPDDILIGPISMLGGARCLCYGPFLHLPAGKWVATLDIEVRQNLSGNRFDVDVFHGAVVALEHFEVPAHGRFRLRARFEVQDPREPVQIRIIMREGAIEGVLEVRSAQVSAEL